MQLTDEERLGMIAAQQLDAHLEDEDQHFRGGEGRLRRGGREVVMVELVEGEG